MQPSLLPWGKKCPKKYVPVSFHFVGITIKKTANGTTVEVGGVKTSSQVINLHQYHTIYCHHSAWRFVWALTLLPSDTSDNAWEISVIPPANVPPHHPSPPPFFQSWALKQENWLKSKEQQLPNKILTEQFIRKKKDILTFYAILAFQRISLMSAAFLKIKIRTPKSTKFFH